MQKLRAAKEMAVLAAGGLDEKTSANALVTSKCHIHVRLTRELPRWSSG